MDFYEFGCAKWERTNQIPNDRPSQGRWDQILEKVNKEMRGKNNIYLAQISVNLHPIQFFLMM